MSQSQHSEIAPSSHACKRCERELPHTLEHFHKQNCKSGIDSTCKKCRAIEGPEWRKNNPEESRKIARQSREKHREKQNAYNRDKRRALRSDPKFRAKLRAQDRARYWKDPEAARAKARCAAKTPRSYEYHRQYKRQKYQNDPSFRVAFIARERIRYALKHFKAKKSTKTFDLIGCTPEFLKWWIESQFLPGMTWRNMGYGNDKWHIDHIYPCSYFDLTNKRQQEICFGWQNLRPLWQLDNLSKGTTVPELWDFEI